MKIYIPTIGRADKQKTADALKAAGIDYTLVLSTAEYDNIGEYQNHGHKVLITDAYGIRATRQWILDHTDDAKVVMMDDDLNFYARHFGKWGKSSSIDLRRMWHAVNDKLDHFAHGGVCEKFMSHARPPGHIENTKYYHILAYNKNLFPNPHPTYRVEIGEDQDMNLQLLTRGYPNFLLTEFANDDKSHAPGGCNEWRNLELETQEALKLCELFPGIVTHIKGPDVRVSWRRAAKAGGLL